MKINQFLHKLFGTTPGKGVQPKEAIAYGVAGFGQNFICTIIGSYLHYSTRTSTSQRLFLNQVNIFSPTRFAGREE